jgi:hypothetical protein
MPYLSSGTLVAAVILQVVVRALFPLPLISSAALLSLEGNLLYITWSKLYSFISRNLYDK